MQIRNPVVCDASKVSLYKKITTICLPARKEQVAIYHNQIFTKINLVIDSIPAMRPRNYQNHRPNQNTPKNKLSYFSIAQETITIIGPARIDLKNKLSYFSIAQETITIIGPARIDLKNKLSYFPTAQETIIITTQPMDMTRKLSQS